MQKMSQGDYLTSHLIRTVGILDKNIEDTFE